MGAEMFILILIAWPLAEVFAFIEVGHAIGFLEAILLLFATSLLGAWLAGVQGRSAIARVSVAATEHDRPARAAIDGALGLLGCLLLVIPGFVTDALGVLLLLPPTRALSRRWLSRHYAGRIVRFAAAGERFAPRRRASRPADVESTAVDEDLDELGR